MPIATARLSAPFAQRSCPACGDSSFADRRVADFLTTHTCQTCGLILSSMSRRRAVVGQYANVDLRAYLNSVGALRDEQSAEIVSLIRPHVRPDARVLDVGCGFGSFLLRARDAGFAVAGIEPDPDACAGAREVLGRHVVRLGTLQQVKPTPGSADVVTTLDVLEHVPPDEHASFARTMWEALAPDGIWAIKVPTTEGLFYRASAVLSNLFPSLSPLPNP